MNRCYEILVVIKLFIFSGYCSHIRDDLRAFHIKCVHTNFMFS